jgi:outer membrane protein assembly factor BamB
MRRRVPSSRALLIAALVVIVLGALTAGVVVFYRIAVVKADATTQPPAVADSHDYSFRCVDGDSGRPLAGVRFSVRIEDWDEKETRTVTSDPRGRFTVADVTAGATVVVTPRPPAGYEGFPLEVSAAESAGAGGDGDAEGGSSAGGTASVVELPLYRSARQWLSWGRTDGRTRVGPETGLPSGRPLWVFSSKYNLEFPPSLAYGLAFFGSYRGFVYAVRQRDGELVWRHHPGQQRSASKFANQVAVSSWIQGSGEGRRRVARVYYANLNGVVGALDAFTGEHVWRRVSGRAPGTDDRTLVFRSFESSPLVAGETVYVASRYHNIDSEAGLWALDRRTGAVRWFCKLGTNDASKIGSSPSFADGRVFLASYDGTVFCIDAESGRIIWKRWLGGAFYSTPAVEGGKLYIGNKSNGFVYCLDAGDGSMLWGTFLGSSVYGSPAVWNGRVFVGAVSYFAALDAAGGEVIWRHPTKKRVLGSASVLDGVVYFSDLGHTYACDARTGKLVWEWGAGRYSPVTATRHLIVVCGRQRLYAFDPSH